MNRSSDSNVRKPRCRELGPGSWCWLGVRFKLMVSNHNCVFLPLPWYPKCNSEPLLHRVEVNAVSIRHACKTFICIQINLKTKSPSDHSQTPSAGKLSEVLARLRTTPLQSQPYASGGDLTLDDGRDGRHFQAALNLRNVSTYALLQAFACAFSPRRAIQWTPVSIPHGPLSG